MSPTKNSARKSIITPDRSSGEFTLERSPLELNHYAESLRSNLAPSGDSSSVTGSDSTFSVPSTSSDDSEDRMVFPDHRIFEPDFSVDNDDHKVYTTNDTNFNWDVTLDGNGNPTRIRGENLLKKGSNPNIKHGERGHTETLDTVSGVGFTQSCHLVADRHGGSGYENSKNTIPGSYFFNNKAQGIIEGDLDTKLPSREYTIEINVTYNDSLLTNFNSIYKEIKPYLTNGKVSKSDLMELKSTSSHLNDTESTDLLKALKDMGLLERNGKVKTTAVDSTLLFSTLRDGGLKDKFTTNTKQKKFAKKVGNFLKKLQHETTKDEVKSRLERLEIDKPGLKRIKTMNYSIEWSKTTPPPEYKIGRDVFLGIPEDRLKKPFSMGAKKIEDMRV
jgi:hypothetical protein